MVFFVWKKSTCLCFFFVFTSVFNVKATVSDDVYEKAESHWAFKPLVESSPPNPQGSTDPIDSYLRKRIIDRELSPSAAAEKSTLARRLSFDLLGLPPNFDDVESLSKDSRPDAISRLVDKLLASPRFGERWGRHWLDVARYADTRGYLDGRVSRSYPFAYVYRDWVVNAFNGGVPFDSFVRNQLAADLIVESSDHQDLAALGFLTVGPRFLNRRHLILDDRIDVISRGLMGFTVVCARCHDHFYDPIPQEDYYSLYGVLDLSIEPKQLPVIGEPDQSSPAYNEYLKKMEELEGAVKEFLLSKWNDIRSEKGLFAYLKVAKDGYDLPDDRLDALAAKRILFPKLAIRWRSYLRKKQISSKRNFSIWNAYAKVSPDSFPQVTKRVLANPTKHLPSLLSHLEKQAPKDFDDVLSIYAKEFALALDSSSGDRPGKELKRLVSSPDFPVAFDFSKVSSLFDILVSNKLNGLRAKIVKHQAEHPGSPPRAMVLEDSKSMRNPRVFDRGNPGKRGREVPRRFLAALAPGGERRPYSKGSGRLELARAITSKENPLTARVIVNRVWQHHFGRGIVDTPGDFGLNGEPPSHPDLLDWLAADFVKHGWDQKRLHRMILLSTVYQQSTKRTPKLDTIDPENRLLARANLRRLEAEAVRDFILATTGDLNLESGGPSIPVTTDAEGKVVIGVQKIRDGLAAGVRGKNDAAFRRSAFIEANRSLPLNILATFDLPEMKPNCDRRRSTTVATQSLWFLNDDQIIQLTGKLSDQLFTGQPTDATQRLNNLHQKLFATPPTDEERRFLSDFLARQEELFRADPNAEWQKKIKAQPNAPGKRALAALAQVLMASNRFLYID